MTQKNGGRVSRMGKEDMHVDDMVNFMSLLEPELPITQELDKWGSKYKSQKSHMVKWFYYQPVGGGSGKAFSYTRKVGNESSRVTYERFMNPGGLLWMAEAFGEEQDTLRKAVAAAIEAEKDNYRKRCIAFRKVIPFDRILELFVNPAGWRYDERLLPIIRFDEECNGAPYIDIEHENTLQEILDDEGCL